MNRTIRLASLAASLILLAGCEKTAEGQVAAVVNGEEITLREVDMEMEMQKVSKGIAESTARQAALQRIVQRRLLAQAARSDGIDQSPDYLIRRRVLDDSLLIQLLAKKIDATIKVPQPSAIDALIKERPAMFANRTMMTIDRIQFAGNESVLKQLEDAHSIDAVVEVLNANKIEFTRGSIQIDSAQLSAPLAAQIQALPAGEPFILPQGGTYTAGVVTATRPNPLADERARPVAVATIRNEQLNKAVERRLAEAKTAAKIEYQPRFAPPKGAADNPTERGAN